MRKVLERSNSMSAYINQNMCFFFQQTLRRSCDDPQGLCEVFCFIRILVILLDFCLLH